MNMKSVKRILCGFLVLAMMVSCIPSIKSSASTTKQQKAFTGLVSEVNDWLAYQYTSVLKKGQTKSIDCCMEDNTVYNMVGANMTNPTAKKLKAKATSIFGFTSDIKKVKTYKTQKAFDTSDQLIGKLANKTYVAKASNWGKNAPYQKVTSVKLSEGRYKAIAITYQKNANGKITKLGTTTFTAQVGEGFKYGYLFCTMKLAK